MYLFVARITLKRKLIPLKYQQSKFLPTKIKFLSYDNKCKCGAQLVSYISIYFTFAIVS